MNSIRVLNFLFRNIHTVLLLLGLACIVIAATLLTNAYYGLLALGVALILLASLINLNEKGG